MISYHPDRQHIGDNRKYSTGWKDAPITDLHRIAKCMSTFVWSHCIWRQGHRQNKNFQSAIFLGLDFDDGVMSLAQALRVFSDSVHVIGTTRSHQKPKGEKPSCDRFRVLIKLDQPITDVPTIKKTSRHYINRWDADGQCSDAARLFLPCKEIVSINADGEAWPVVVSEIEDDAAPATLEDGELTPYCVYYMRNVVPPGQRNLSAHRFAKDLHRAGFDTATIYRMICQSPTYAGQEISYDLKNEFDGLIASAVRAVTEEGERVGKEKCGENL